MMTDRAIKLVFILTCFFFIVVVALKADASDWRDSVTLECDCYTTDQQPIPQDSYVVPRLGGGHVEVYPGRGTVTVTPPDPLGTVNIYRDGFLPKSRY